MKENKNEMINRAEKERKKHREYMRIWLKRNPSKYENMKINFKHYYLKNKNKIINRIKNNQKKSNYIFEKTKKQKQIRNIKRNTRYYFPLNEHNCEFCLERATEHHHNTFPIEFDKFNFICHNCHIKQNEILKGGKEI